MKRLFLLSLLFCGACGFQHLRFENDSAGFDDLFYLMEPTLKLYDLERVEGQEQMQYAPFALVYTGPPGRTVHIASELQEYEAGESELEPTSFEHCLWSQNSGADGSAVQQSRIFGDGQGSCGTDIEIPIEDDATDMTQYLQLRTPKSEGLKNGRWYRLSLTVVAMGDKDFVEQRSELVYDFYVSQSESLIGFGVGTGLVLVFSLLGL